MRSPSSRRARIGWLTTIVSLALAPCSLDVAAEPPTARIQEPTTSSALVVEVEMDPTIPDAETLAEWVHEESLQALAQLEVPPTHGGTLRVSVSGALYEYEVAITTIREGSTEGDTVSWSCECSNDDMLARIRTGVRTAAEALSRTSQSTEPAPPSRARSLRGAIGLGLIAGGAAGALAGIVLMSIGKRERAHPEDAARILYEDYRVPGVPTFLVGVGLLAAGMALVVLDRRNRTRQPLAGARPVMLVGHRGLHFGLTGSF